ncbi:unnamed protein product [Diplocarpon coronariae]|uniref:Uncharacterized protein n=1 Tax=Diplocarpon coronariae TaxID=2795749 RepID=A0A218YWC0_9HELO|nr:hypothetical protein JHW43_005057 [Diplocarpon mali]OWO99773.1 hypothetical protein B2J93_6828 [Marssonina coronariae]
MQSIAAVSVALFATIASAAPPATNAPSTNAPATKAFPDTIVNFLDEVTELTANVTVPVNAGNVSLKDELTFSELDIARKIPANQIQLVENYVGIECHMSFIDGDDLVITVNEANPKRVFTGRHSSYDLAWAQIKCVSVGTADISNTASTAGTADSTDTEEDAYTDDSTDTDEDADRAGPFGTQT